MTFCKDDCMYCTSASSSSHDYRNFFKNCVGPDQMKLIKDFPRDSCKTFTLEEQSGVLENLEASKSVKSIPESRREIISLELCSCSEDGCNAKAPDTTNDPPKKSLQCYVGYSKVHVEFLEGLDPNFKMSRSLYPQRIMDCKAWHDIQEQEKRNTIRELTNNGDPLNQLPRIKNMTFCKDDCMYCTSESSSLHGNRNFLKSCVGPDQMKLLNGFPRDSCRSFSSEEVSEVLRNSVASRAEKFTPGLRRQNELRELCTCSDDGCNDDPPPPTIETGKIFSKMAL